MEKKCTMKGQDELLAYKGRPSLFYPAMRAEVDDEVASSAGFPSRLASGLGTAKFLCGACLALLGGMAVYVQAWSAWMYGGIWSGLFAIFTGLCIILAARRQKPQRKSLLVALLVLSVLGFFNTGLLATFTAMGLVAEVYMEDVAGSLVWRGVENASPFAVQLLLLATATADSLLSLACCVISGREICCCGKPTPALLSTQRRDRLIRWLGSQQNPAPPPQKVLNLPPVRLIPSVRQHPRDRPPKTPPTMRIVPIAAESLPSSTSTSKPLVKRDSNGKRRRVSIEIDPDPSPSTTTDVNDSSQSSNGINEKYFALDKKLSEDFIDRTRVFESC